MSFFLETSKFEKTYEDYVGGYWYKLSDSTNTFSIGFRIQQVYKNGIGGFLEVLSSSYDVNLRGYENFSLSDLNLGTGFIVSINTLE